MTRSMTAAKKVRKNVVPEAPITGNKVLASDVPTQSDMIPPSMAIIGKSDEEREMVLLLTFILSTASEETGLIVTQDNPFSGKRPEHRR